MRRQTTTPYCEKRCQDGIIGKGQGSSHFVADLSDLSVDVWGNRLAPVDTSQLTSKRWVQWDDLKPELACFVRRWDLAFDGQRLPDSGRDHGDGPARFGFLEC